jgi:LacI family transcriptional regulator
MSKGKKPQQRRITIKDIAAMANVSIGTVDRVLHNRGEVNPATQERILSFVEKLGYTPNLLAKSLALKKEFVIVALIPDPANDTPYWKMPLAGFTRAMEELKDFNTKIAVQNYDPATEQSFITAFEKAIKQNPDGIILAPNFHQAALSLIPQCKTRNIPIMLVDNNLDDGSGLAYFGQNALQSGVVAAKLMNIGLPAESTVLILNLARNRVITRHMQSREKGFTDYFKNEVPGQAIRTVSVEIDLSQHKEPEATLKRILSVHNSIAGIFVTNSRVHRVAGYLQKSGKKDIVLMGYDLTEANEKYLRNGIIDFLICQKPEEQGFRSAMAMFNYLLTDKQADRVNYSPIDIIIRENVDYYKNIN